MRIGMLIVCASLAMLPVTGASWEVEQVEALVEDNVGTAPLYCGPEACTAPSCASAAQAELDCTRAPRCGWAQQWQVRGKYDSGNGTVEFSVHCGDDVVVSCSVNASGADGCKSDIRGPGKKDFGCFHEITDGSPVDINGKCIDPVNPEVVYLAIPAGTPYEMDKYVVRIGKTAEARVLSLV